MASAALRIDRPFLYMVEFMRQPDNNPQNMLQYRCLSNSYADSFKN